MVEDRLRGGEAFSCDQAGFEQIRRTEARRRRVESQGGEAIEDDGREKREVAEDEGERAHVHCLYDALALVEFLALRKLYATWVFAVQAQPFGAHCWVQTGEHLLNEATEYAQEFTPIMEV
ncbi:MAG: lasso peptide biosynthesis B2 protein [Burkholderiales bacterium]|nr:MAG: lasso peptide biosynthesis B2 protein [Burkholderiales bacterium]